MIDVSLVSSKFMITAERASRRERRESAWAICEKVMLVIAALGGIAAVADLVLSRLGL